MKVTLGVDVACRAAHQASCVDEAGQFVWSGIRFHTAPDELEGLWARLPEGADEVVLVLEPTRNAWVPLAAWFRARGAAIVLVPPEQSADLRNYYNKHTKTDRLDSRVLAKLPRLHADRPLRTFDDAGPADPLRRAVRRRARLVERRVAVYQRIDALLELLGPAWISVLGGTDYGKTALLVLERGLGDPNTLLKFGRKRLTAVLVKGSRGAWREDKADALIVAARTTLRIWGDTGDLDFAELAEDLSGEARIAALLTGEIEALEERIAALYDRADPKGIIVSGPGFGVTLAAAILGGFGDLRRFANLAGVRAFTGLVPRLDQSGTSERHGSITRAGDPALRAALFMAADHARTVDPQLAARYHRLVVTERKHHTSAVCTLAAVLATRLAACWRDGTPYVLRDTDGTEITAQEGRHICEGRYKVTAEQRAARRTLRTAQRLKTGTSRRRKESRSAPATGPSTPQATTSQPSVRPTSTGPRSLAKAHSDQDTPGRRGG